MKVHDVSSSKKLENRDSKPKNEINRYEYLDDILDIEDAALLKDKINLNPRAAILIDDMGWSTSKADELFNIDADLSYAILPGLAFSKIIAKKAGNLNFDVLLHMPMEPKGYPDVNPGEEVILNNMRKEEVLKKLDKFVGLFPNIIGINNHMGSSLTENGRIMKIVINYLKEKNLFFVDSLTSSKTVGYKIAVKAGVKTAKRNVFLDNVEDVEYIKNQLRKLIKIAIKEGTAIGIGHPHRTTVTALAEIVSEFREAGVDIVPVSELVK